MYPSFAEAKKQYAAMQKALAAAEQEIERKRQKVSELAEAMNTLKGQKLAEEENQKTAKSLQQKRKKNMQNFWKNPGLFPKKHTTLQSCRSGADPNWSGKRKSMSLSA